MRNFVQNGERLKLYPAADVSSGDVVVVGGIIGVAFANYAVADGTGVVCDLQGVYSLPKATGAWAQGDELYYDATAKNVTATATGNTLIGLAADVATADATEGLVLLKG